MKISWNVSYLNRNTLVRESSLWKHLLHTRLFPIYARLDFKFNFCRTEFTQSIWCVFLIRFQIGTINRIEYENQKLTWTEERRREPGRRKEATPRQIHVQVNSSIRRKFLWLFLALLPRPLRPLLLWQWWTFEITIYPIQTKSIKSIR